MLIANIFRPDETAIDALIAEYPFALVISAGDTLNATPLPILLERHAGGARLIGHFARANPQVEQLRQSPQALFVFQGPHGYVSPSWMADRTQAPTWNFTAVHIDAEITFLDDVASSRAAVERLTDYMEAGRPSAWAAPELGERYERLIRGVIAFEAEIKSVDAKFKLGQNERLDVLVDILEGLEATGQDPLRAAMIAANRNRLGPDAPIILVSNE